MSPTAPPPTATVPKTPKALPRSCGLRNVVTSVAECGRCEHSASGTLEGPGDDQNRERRCGAAEGRRRSKGHQRDQERPFAPDDVADPTPKEQ